MKLIRYLSLCLVAQFALLVSLPVAEAESAYQQAVTAYVTAAAGSELQAMRAQAEAAQNAASEDKKEIYKDFFAKLEKCEATHKTLKTAKDFDKTKALYEQQRLDAVKAWTKVVAK